MKSSTVVKRSIVFDGRKTSVSLEDEFWNFLKEIAEERDETLRDLVAEIDDDRDEHCNLSSAIRLFVLGYAQAEATSDAASPRTREAAADRARDQKCE